MMAMASPSGVGGSVTWGPGGAFWTVLNSFLRRCWFRASEIPVPQSWKATNRRMRTPRVMRARPTPATTRRTPMSDESTALSPPESGTLGALGSPRRPPGSLVLSMASVVVHLHGAVSLLGRFTALAGVDLDVAAGEVVLVQGPNGAGKTTLLRASAGLVPIVDGEATVLGHDLRKDRRSVRRGVALLGHASALYDDLTVADNLRFVARASRVEGAPSVDDALARLGLAGRLAGVQVARLSAGQRRRVAVAAMLL